VGQSSQGTLAERWNGHRWHIQPTPNPGGAQSYLDDVSCTGSFACTAVGASNLGTLAEHWNGTKWRIQPTPNPAQGGGFLLGVACTSSSSCSAVGGSNAGTLAERWNASRWRIVPTPNPPGAQFSVLNSADCSASAACTAVGWYFDASGHLLTLAERWNGTKWSIQRTSNPDGTQGDQLIGVACPISKACTAFGVSRVSNFSGTPLPMVQRWNGHSWRLQRTPNPRGARGAQLLGISCVSPSSCMAVGESTLGTVAERWNGKVWAIEPTPRPAGAGSSGLDGVSCASPANCTAVGGSSAFAGGTPFGTLVERWNGHRWHIQPTPTSHSPGHVFNAVSCSSAAACTAVGNTASGLLAERWNGTSWKTQHVPIPARMHGGVLTGVSCTSASVCTAVGEGLDISGNFVGTITERWHDHRWSIQPTPTSKRPGYFLGAVSCTSASACTAVGSTPSKLLAERWNGTAWTVQSTPTPPAAVGQGPCDSSSRSCFNSVSCSSRSACTATGNGFPPSGPLTIAERWNGTKWSIQPTPNLPGIYDLDPFFVSCPTQSICTAVGGYTNNGVKLTLAERWHAGHADSHLVTRPSRSVNRSLACAPSARQAPFARRELRLSTTSAESCALS
jgi:hypothetical protein